MRLSDTGEHSVAELAGLFSVTRGAGLLGAREGRALSRWRAQMIRKA